MKAPPNHIKTVLDGLGLFTWSLSPGDGMLIDQLKDIVEQI